jgi:uncharacterized protein YbjT (DUF2867 family)
MTTAFVAGATGFVGRAVVSALIARGVRTIAHIRPESSKLDTYRERFVSLGAEVDTSPWELGAMTSALARSGVTHVFGLLGTTRASARAEKVEGDIYERIDHQLTRLLCDAALAAGQQPRFILLSSISARTSAAHPYLRAHGKAEEAIRASGLPWIVARPSFIVPGRGGAQRDDRRAGEKAAATAIDGLLAVIGLAAPRLRARVRSTTPEILAEALVRLGLDGDPDRIVEGDELRIPRA